MKIKKEVTITEEEMFDAFVRRHGHNSFQVAVDYLAKDEENVEDLYHTVHVIKWAIGHYRKMREEHGDIKELNPIMLELMNDMLIVKIKE